MYVCMYVCVSVCGYMYFETVSTALSEIEGTLDLALSLLPFGVVVHEEGLDESWCYDYTWWFRFFGPPPLLLLFLLRLFLLVGSSQNPLQAPSFRISSVTWGQNTRWYSTRNGATASRIGHSIIISFNIHPQFCLLPINPPPLPLPHPWPTLIEGSVQQKCQMSSSFTPHHWERERERARKIWRLSLKNPHKTQSQACT